MNRKISIFDRFKRIQEIDLLQNYRIAYFELGKNESNKADV